MRRQWYAVVLVLCVIGGVRASAQSPQTQPLLQSSSIKYVGSFAVPDSDGTCNWTTDVRGCLTFSGYALGVGLNGTLYYGGHDWADQLCQITLPNVGGRATVVTRCQTVPKLSSIDPGDSGNGYVLGGSLLYNGRLLVSAYSYYDNAPYATGTHFVSTPQLTGWQGPYMVGAKAGIIGGYMTLIPAEWRALFGGPALTGLCCTATIGRSSSGPALAVFNPDDVGKVSPVPVTQLLEYPDGPNSLSPWNSKSELFNMSTQMAGVVWPAGTRSVLFVQRQGTGDPCYGDAAKCGDAFDGVSTTHAQPYRLQVVAYDANDLLAVKQGTKQPYQPRPYAVWPLTGVNDTGGATARSAAYDPATRRLYLTTVQGEQPRVHVFEVAAPSAPAPVDCVLSAPTEWAAMGPWTACVAGQQTQPQRRTRSVVTAPANGGAACGPLEETRVAVQACTVAPPVEPKILCSANQDGSWTCRIAQ